MIWSNIFACLDRKNFAEKKNFNIRQRNVYPPEQIEYNT